ncbi:Spo0B domain-containing protein [Herbiconiux sp.]|uniref:Spo0B domain-containing protein n=1 Tax=Herbiconiux sp. TaxID=1871186 RepID=UPI0025BBFB8A|nr:Spo0B domain-containing protein [Herbiconiux sp.]
MATRRSATGHGAGERGARVHGARFTTQVNRSIVLAMIAVSLITTALFAVTAFNRLVQQTQESALRVAQSVASTPDVRAAAEEESRRAVASTDAQLVAGDLDDYARSVEARTGALFVVITDDTGRRLAHPNPAEIGDPVSTSPDAALRGEEVVSWERGTLGDSARAKVPIFGVVSPETIVGEVSVGLPPAEVWSTVLSDAVPVALTTALALGVGALLATFIARRLRRKTLGLEPEELLALVHDQQAVLQGVDDGVLGLSTSDVVTVCNDRAALLLGLRSPVGLPLAEAVPHPEVLARIRAARMPDEPRVRDASPVPGASRVPDASRAADASRASSTSAPTPAASAATPSAPAAESRPSALRTGENGGMGTLRRDSAGAGAGAGGPLVVGARMLFVDVHEVRREGRLLGRVVIVRDVTDVEDLTRRLTAVGTLASALREQRHEFANRIHVVTGLVRAGDTEEALEYLAEVGDHGPVRFPLEGAGRIREPYLQAFLGAKAIEAERRGVLLRVGPDADVVGSLRHPEDVTTVLGNLVDNGIAAAAASLRTPRWVEVEALRHGDELHLSVMDSGDGAVRDPLADADASGTATSDDGDAPDGTADAPSAVGERAARDAPVASGAPRTPEAADAPSAVDESAALDAPVVPGASDAADAGGGLGRASARGAADVGGAAGEAAHGHGIGLRLSAEVARRNGGELWLAMAGGGDVRTTSGLPHGAVFCARLEEQFEREDGS